MLLTHLAFLMLENLLTNTFLNSRSGTFGSFIFADFLIVQMYFTIRGFKFDIANEHGAALINYIIMVTYGNMVRHSPVKRALVGSNPAHHIKCRRFEPAFYLAIDRKDSTCNSTISKRNRHNTSFIFY